MPIRFDIFKDGSAVKNFTPVAGMCTGPEGVPMVGEVLFNNGVLEIRRSEEHPAGLSLLWDAGNAGEYALDTARVQPREQPFNLNVELARGRLMRLVQKQEDWTLFDFPKAEKLTQRFRDLQAEFADALGLLSTGGKAAKLADAVLASSIELSEEMTMFHADLLLANRKQRNSLARHIFGCRIDPTIANQKYRDFITENFDFAVLPMSWKHLQPEEGVFHTEVIDEWVELLAKKKVPVIAGPLVDLSEDAVPDWMFIWEHDFETLRELALEYVQRVVSQYKRHIMAWNVVAGVQTNAAFTLNFEQIIELTRLLVSRVKAVQSGAVAYVTITHPHGEYHARGSTSVPPMLYAEMVAQSGVAVDAFAVEIEMGVPTSGRYVRDLFQISSMLDRFSTLGKRLIVTSAACPARHSPDSQDQSEGRLDPAKAGRWRKPWDATLQGQWLDAVHRIALSKPFIDSVAWGNLADLSPSMPAGGLLDDTFKPKPAYKVLQELQESYQRQSKRT